MGASATFPSVGLKPILLRRPARRQESSYHGRPDGRLAGTDPAFSDQGAFRAKSM